MEESLPCSVCGNEHSRSALELYFVRPDPIVALSESEREERCQESDDLCVIKWERFFVRGVLPLPVPEREQPYQVGVWAEVKPQDFKTILDLWSDETQSSTPPFIGMLANHIPNHKNTLGLEVKVALSGPTTRPKFYIVNQEHDLYDEQNNGISSHRAYEYSSLF